MPSSCQPAFGSQRAETVRVDDTVARPYHVNTLAGSKRRHGLVGVDPHQENGVAVVLVGLITEPRGSVVDPGLKLNQRQRDDLTTELSSRNAVGNIFSTLRATASAASFDRRMTFPL